MKYEPIGRELERRRSRHRNKLRDDYAARHPQRAAEERAMKRNQASLEERYGHRRAPTPETLDKASHVQQGAMARLFQNGHLSIDQLAFSQEIRGVAELIQREVGLAVVSVETRVDNGAAQFRREEQSLGRVRAEMAYTAWRRSLARPAPVLAMVVEDRMCRGVARAFRMRDATLRAMVSQALDAWPDFCRDARDRVSEADLRAAEARLA